jgi:hypothetical protein
MLAGYLLHVLSSDILKIERISAAASGCAPARSCVSPTSETDELRSVTRKDVAAHAGTDLG